MKRFAFGLIVGSILTGSLGVAGTFYDRDGQPNAPRGSIQSFDYFRQRQQFLDIQAMRRQADQDQLSHMTNPCAK